MKKNGFTFVELMLVITIIGLLAMISVPLYQTYSTRSKLNEAIVIVSPLKVAIAEAYMSNGLISLNTFANNYNSENSNIQRNLYVSNVVVGSQGTITVTISNNSNISNEVKGKTLVFTPNINHKKLDNQLGGIDWACASISNLNATSKNLESDIGTLPSKYVPADCR